MRAELTMQARLVAIAKHRLERRIREQQQAAARERQHAAICVAIDQHGELVLARRAAEQQALVSTPQHAAIHQYNLVRVRASLHETVAQKKVAADELAAAAQQRLKAQALSAGAMKRMTKLERFAELCIKAPEHD